MDNILELVSIEIRKQRELCKIVGHVWDRLLSGDQLCLRCGLVKVHDGRFLDVWLNEDPNEDKDTTTEAVFYWKNKKQQNTSR